MIFDEPKFKILNLCIDPEGWKNIYVFYVRNTLMKDAAIYNQITGKVLELVHIVFHEVVQSIDDSTSTIGANTNYEIKRYTEQYLHLLVL